MILLFAGLAACNEPAPKQTKSASGAYISEVTINQVIDSLKQKTGVANIIRLKKGVKHTALLWQAEDGTANDFSTFCKVNYVVSAAERELLFDKVSKNFESIYGHFNKMSLDLRENVDLNNGPMLEIDKEFSGYSVGAQIGRASCRERV